MSGEGETHNVLKSKYEMFLADPRWDYTNRITNVMADFLPSSDSSSPRKSSSSSSSSAAAAISSNPSAPRLIVNLNDLRQYDSKLLTGLLGNTSSADNLPQKHLQALEAAAQTIAVRESGLSDGLSPAGQLKVGLEGNFGEQHVSPRGLLSTCLRHMVCVEGIVTKCSVVRPKLVKTVHYCPDTGSITSREYRDNTDLRLGLPQLDADGVENASGLTYSVTNTTIPQKDKEGHLLETEFGLCQYKDHQVVTIQEMPERAPMGQLPRSVDVILDFDLVDKVKPGDRVQATGLFTALTMSGKSGGPISGVFKTAVICNNVKPMGRDTKEVTLVAEDITNIKAIGKRGDVLEILGRSIAPSIYGHDYIKKALALQLLSGMEKNLDNGTHIRGDINILMVGDPSTAKSQLLRTALQVAALAISTTGRGSSGVGLTAAVTMDAETGDKRLEAGAMVLGDRGLVCIDEFDKMSEQDRVAIHEVMEQQTVTIAKAGIHASLNARCSVLAAANPVYGQYDKARRPQENIGLPDSLLSRFDLLFLVLDQLDPENDRRIAAHVLRGHRYRKPGTDMEPEPLQAVNDEDEEDDEEAMAKKLQVWVKSHHAVQGGGAGREDKEHGDDVLSQDFLRKYIFYAKTKKPVLEEESREYISNRYAEMRSKQDDKTLPVTARSLETIIRLSSAHAKARLSDKVEVVDCEGAMDILSFALYHEEDAVKKRKAKELEEAEGDNEGEGEEEEVDENERPQVRSKPNPQIASPQIGKSLKSPADRFQDAIHALKTQKPDGFEKSEAVEMSGLNSDVVDGFMEQYIEANKLMIDDDDMVYFI